MDKIKLAQELIKLAKQLQSSVDSDTKDVFNLFEKILKESDDSLNKNEFVDKDQMVYDLGKIITKLTAIKNSINKADDIEEYSELCDDFVDEIRRRIK